MWTRSTGCGANSDASYARVGSPTRVNRDPSERSVVEQAARLFNEKLYFECHDLLEEAWTEAKGTKRSFLHALIHIAVGMYHVAAANHQGAVNLLSRGIAALEPFLPEHDRLDTAALVEAARVCCEKSSLALSGAAMTWEPEDVPRMDVTALE